jgi:hypothetical protein
VVIAAFKPHIPLFSSRIRIIWRLVYRRSLCHFLKLNILVWLSRCNIRNICSMFGLYKYKIVKVTEQFKSVVIAATLAIATYYLISWVFYVY